MSSNKFKPDDIVLLKISGYKPWPSIVCPESKLPFNILLKKPKPKLNLKNIMISYPVYFLADGTFSWCNENQLTLFGDKQVEDFNKTKSKLKQGVYLQSFELALTNPTCEQVLPVFLDPVEEEPVKKVNNKRKLQPLLLLLLLLLLKRKRASTRSSTASPAPILGKRKKAASIIIESSSEEEEEEEEEEDEEEEAEEEEIRQSFIPDSIDSKSLLEDLKKNSKNILQLRLELQKKLLIPDFITEVDDNSSKSFINHYSKLNNSNQVISILDKLSNFASNSNNFILFKKYKIFKILYLAMSKPELLQLSNIKKKISVILEKFDFEKEEIGEIDSNWSCSFKEEEANSYRSTRN